MGNKAIIIGIGDVWQGDLGIGSYAIEALAQENLGEKVELADLGPRVAEIDVHLYRADLAIIVQGLTLGTSPGSIFKWDWHGLKQNMSWLYPALDLAPVLFYMLNLAEQCGFLSSSLLFVGVEAAITSGLTLSAIGLKALRKVVCLIKKHLRQRGFLPEVTPQILPLYRLSLLNVVA